MRTCDIATEWILFLNTDEEPTTAFNAKLKRVLLTTTHNRFFLAYDLFFLGRRLRFGMPQRKVSLVCSGSGEYEQIDD